MMENGHEKAIDKVTFKMLDSRKTPNGNEYDIEVNKEKERRVAILKLFGLNKRKCGNCDDNKSSLMKHWKLMLSNNFLIDLILKMDG